MNDFLAGKTILITGGSSRLGKAFVRKACDAGARVFFTYFQHGAETEIFLKDGAKGFALDLLDMRSIEAFAKILKKETSSLDILIHNAAAVRDSTIQNMTEEAWDEVLLADLKAPYYLTKKLLSLIFASEQEVKKIFFLTSRVAIHGGYGVANYASAKAGVIALAKSLAQELGKKKILVNALNPGFMKSRMTENIPETAIQKNLDASPLGCYSEPDEVADFLVYLCSDRMKQVTGQLIHFESRKI